MYIESERNEEQKGSISLKDYKTSWHVDWMHLFFQIFSHIDLHTRMVFLQVINELQKNIDISFLFSLPMITQT